MLMATYFFGTVHLFQESSFLQRFNRSMCCNFILTPSIHPNKQRPVSFCTLKRWSFISAKVNTEEEVILIALQIKIMTDGQKQVRIWSVINLLCVFIIIKSGGTTSREDALFHQIFIFTILHLYILYYSVNINHHPHRSPGRPTWRWLWVHQPPLPSWRASPWYRRLLPPRRSQAPAVVRRRLPSSSPPPERVLPHCPCTPLPATWNAQWSPSCCRIPCHHRSCPWPSSGQITAMRINLYQ